MKAPYMIIPYSAGNNKCWEKVRPHMNGLNKLGAEDVFNNIWKFVRNDMWIILGYSQNFTEYVKTLQSFKIESETAIADLSYFHMDSYRLDVGKGATRSTRTISYPSAFINRDKIMTSTPPNLIAFTESEILRIMSEEPWNFSILTVHDAFFPSIFDCGRLVRCYGQIFYIKLKLHGKPPRTTLL
jgi:hypothetical protein